MKVNGGYDIPLSGKPDDEVAVQETPDELYLPLWTKRFEFTDLQVEHGQQVEAGQPLARGSEAHHLPLVAPRGGTVDLEKADKHVTLKEVGEARQEPIPPDVVKERVPEPLELAPRHQVEELVRAADLDVGHLVLVQHLHDTISLFSG